MSSIHQPIRPYYQKKAVGINSRHKKGRGVPSFVFCQVVDYSKRLGLNLCQLNNATETKNENAKIMYQGIPHSVNMSKTTQKIPKHIRKNNRNRPSCLARSMTITSIPRLSLPPIKIKSQNVSYGEPITR